MGAHFRETPVIFTFTQEDPHADRQKISFRRESRIEGAVAIRHRRRQVGAERRCRGHGWQNHARRPGDGRQGR